MQVTVPAYTVIYCANYEQYFLQERLEEALSKVVEWCAKNFININIGKTKFCIYGTRNRVSKFTSDTIGAHDCIINRTHNYTYLGVILDECLHMKPNFNQTIKKFSNKIYQFGKIIKYLNTETRSLVYKQTIMPLVEYVSFVLNLNTKHEIDKLQRLQNKALRMCFNIRNPRDIGILDLHRRAKIDTLHRRRDMHLL